MSNTEPDRSTQTESAVTNKDVSQFVGFRIDDQDYGFPIEQIQEIVILDQVTRMPQVPSFVEGVSNLRGTIIPVIGLRRLFDLPEKSIDEETRTIVVNVGERVVGCTVDSVSQVMRIEAEQIQPAPEMIIGEGTSYVMGFARRESQLVVLLDVNELLDPAKLESVHKAAQRGEALPDGAKLPSEQVDSSESNEAPP